MKYYIYVDKMLSDQEDIIEKVKIQIKNAWKLSFTNKDLIIEQSIKNDSTCIAKVRKQDVQNSNGYVLKSICYI